MNHGYWIASCILLAFGALGMTGGAIWRALQERKDANLRFTVARVVEIINEPGMRKAVQSQFCNADIAVFEYYADGKLIKVRDKKETYPCPYQLNQSFKICYYPDKPEEFMFVERDTRKIMAVLLERAGIGFIILGCILFFIYVKRF